MSNKSLTSIHQLRFEEFKALAISEFPELALELGFRFSESNSELDNYLYLGEVNWLMVYYFKNTTWAVSYGSNLVFGNSLREASKNWDVQYREMMDARDAQLSEMNSENW